MKTEIRLPILAFLGLILSLGFLGRTTCYFGESSPPDTSANDAGTLEIVTSITIPQDFVRQIAGEGLLASGHVSVYSINDEADDPHTFTGPTAEEKQKMDDADLLLYMGVGVDKAWFEASYDSLTNKPTKVALVNDSQMQPDPAHDNEPNPHTWMNVSVAKHMVQNITQEMKGALGAKADLPAWASSAFDGNASRYLAQLDSLLLWMQGNQTAGYNFRASPNNVTVQHASFFYVWPALGIARVGVLEVHEGESPAAHHQETIAKMAEENCVLIITQPQQDESEVWGIARAAGAKIATLTPLLDVDGPSEWAQSPHCPDGTKSIDTYVEMHLYNMWALQNNLHDPPAELAWVWWVLGIGALAGVGATLAVLRRR